MGRGGGRGGGHGLFSNPPELRGHQRQRGPSLGGDTAFQLHSQKQVKQWQGPLGPANCSGPRFTLPPIRIPIPPANICAATHTHLSAVKSLPSAAATWSRRPDLYPQQGTASVSPSHPRSRRVQQVSPSFRLVLRLARSKNRALCFEGKDALQESEPPYNPLSHTVLVKSRY